MTDAARYAVVTVACAERAAACALGRALVEARLAACAQIDGPMESTYRWDGEIVVAPEWRLTLKTRSDRLDALTAAVAERHAYDVPEIVAVPIVHGSAPYLAWIDASLDA